MLEKRIVPEEAAYGGGYLNCGTAGLTNGALVKLNGSWSAQAVTGVLGTTYANRPGWARTGAPLYAPMENSDTAQAVPETWIIKKYEYQRETSDLALDVIYSGEGIVAYDQGFFETDAYSLHQGATSWATVAIGAGLIASGGYLATGSAIALSYQPRRAIYWGYKSSYDTNYWAKPPIYIQLLKVAISGLS